MEQERDPRFRKLSTGGAILNFIGALIALIATVSSRWAVLSGASYVAAAAAVLSTVGLCCGFIISIMVVAMHQAQHPICMKFRHATFSRMILSGTAAMFALISFATFLLESKLFLRMQSSHRTGFSWGFYLEILTFLFACIIGAIASVEWRWSRKLGGDPTVYTRDPEGTKADTYVNPNFHDDPNPTSNHKTRGGGSGAITRNSNGIAMTATSGLPYMVTSNGRPKSNYSNGRRIVAFDPGKTPMRSSLRRPKPAPPEDQVDKELTVQNPAFSNSSPPQKKKVRIFTQSTAV